MGRSAIVATIVALGAAVVLALVGQPVLAGAALVGWIAWLASITIRGTASERTSDPRENMHAESRSLYAPINRLTGEIESLVSAHSDSSIMKVVGGEAVEEAKRIRSQVATALAVRDTLKSTLRERGLADQQMADLKAKADVAASPEEKTSLLSALEAKQLEVQHYGEVDTAVAQIDSGVARANAALSEMKARLGMKLSTASAEALQTNDDDLRETISRMKDLSVSYDEAEQLLNP